LDQPGRIALAPADTFLRGVWPYAISIVLLGTLLAWLLTRGITDSIVRLAGAAQGITSGDLSQRVGVRRNDEIGDLADAFNTMAEQVSQSHHDLENQVAERTVELRAAYGQLIEKQDELVRAEKLATLGQLASGVGHELRTPLGVMTNAVYYLEIVLSEAPETVHEYRDILRGQIGLSEKIVGDLLDFARLKPPQVELVSIESIVDHQIKRLGPLNGVTLSKEFPVDLSQVAVDPIQIGQVVLNLLMNGVQAMVSQGGTLWVRAYTRGDQVELAVTDEGEGIPETNVEKIFEPLFTTKARGIGLGLAVSRSLAQGNRGTLTASSPTGEGATFLLTLPTHPEEGSG
jgi:signal transduction histidine kinase